MTSTEEATAQVHEWFAGLIKAGFTREEALHMVTAVLIHNIKEN